MSEFEEHKSHVISRAMVITLLPFLPIPLLDWFLEPVLAKKMLEPIMKYPEHGRHFVGKGGCFCLGCITGVLLYPFTKLFKILGFFLNFKKFIRTFYYWLYKSYILHQAQIELRDDTLQDHQVMLTFGQDLDTWLRTSPTVPNLGISQLSNFQAMQMVLQKISNEGMESLAILQDTQVLDDWLSLWIEKFKAEA